MANTRVVHVNDNVPGAIYIGRAVPRRGIKTSKWANPFRISADMTRYEAIECYDAEITAGSRAGLLADLPELRGKALACWCRHDGEERTVANACHGDVLVEILETYTDDELQELSTWRQ